MKKTWHERLGGPSGLAALLVSAGLHVAVLVAVKWTPPPPVVTPPAALAWVEVAPVIPEPPPVRPPEPPTKQNAPVKKKRSTTAPVGAPRAESAPANGALTSDAPVATTGAGPPIAVTPGSRPSLIPRAGFVMSMPEASDAEDTRGTTLRNDPRDLPDEQAVAEYQAEKANRKLGLDLAADVARAQQGAGRMPGYFSSFRRSLQDATEKAKVQVSKDSERDQTRRAFSTIFDPTNTRPSEEAIKRVSDSAFVQNQQRMGNPSLPGDQQQFNNAVAQSMTRLESIKESLSAPLLRTVISLTTDPRGILAEASIEEKSGDVTFDESVLHLSRKVARDLPDSDDKALGSTWWRSRWVFTWEPPRMRVRLLEATPLPARLQ